MEPLKTEPGMSRKLEQELKTSPGPDLRTPGAGRRLAPFFTLLALLAIPLIVVSLSVSFNKAQGPGWLAANSDPDYIYLFNAMNLLINKPPHHVDHPGTPVQVWGAMVMSLTHKIAGEADLVRDVAKRPEFYLNAVNYSFLFCYGAVLFIIGIAVWRLTKNIWLSLLLQATPLLSIHSITQSTNFRPESFLLILSAIYSWAILIYLFGPGDRSENYFSVVFGMLMGLAMASKITALPLTVIPLLILTRLRSKLLYMLVSLGSFIVAVIPIILAGKGGFFLRWVFRLLTNVGEYGTGDIGLIDTANYFNSFKGLLTSNLPLFAGLLAGSALVLWSWRRDRTKQSEPSARKLRLGLVAVMAAQLLQLVMVAKYPRDYYLVPSLGLLGLNLALMLGLILKEQRKNTTLIAPIFACLVAVGLLIFGIPSIRATTAALEKSKVAQLKAFAESDKYKGWTKVCYYQCSSPAYASYFGNYNAADRYTKILQELYPDFVGYHIWNKSYYRFGSKTRSTTGKKPQGSIPRH